MVSENNKGLAHKLFFWGKSEKGMILWTSLIGLACGLMYANAVSDSFPSVKWIGAVFSGVATVSILSSVLNRYVIALNREKSGETTKDIHSLVAKSESLISRREMLLESERKIERFKKFLQFETYHNITFPNINSCDSNAHNLEYTIRPVRDLETGEPVKYLTEMTMAYLVYIEGPAHINVMTESRLKHYDNSPIHEAEYAFCRFLNGAWHLGFESSLSPYEFYLSGKVGPIEYGQTANQFMRNIDDRFRDKILIASFVLKSDGTLLTGVGSGSIYEIYKDQSANLYLKIGGSLPKAMYYTQPKNTWGNEGWFLLIENFRGYATGEKLANVVLAIEAKLKTLATEPKKIKWFESKHQMNMPDK